MKQFEEKIFWENEIISPLASSSELSETCRSGRVTCFWGAEEVVLVVLVVSLAHEMSRINVNVEMFARMPVRLEIHGWWYLWVWLKSFSLEEEYANLPTLCDADRWAARESPFWPSRSDSLENIIVIHFCWPWRPVPPFAKLSLLHLNELWLKFQLKLSCRRGGVVLEVEEEGHPHLGDDYWWACLEGKERKKWEESKSEGQEWKGIKEKVKVRKGRKKRRSVAHSHPPSHLQNMDK